MNPLIPLVAAAGGLYLLTRKKATIVVGGGAPPGGFGPVTVTRPDDAMWDSTVPVEIRVGNSLVFPQPPGDWPLAEAHQEPLEGLPLPPPFTYTLPNGQVKITGSREGIGRLTLSAEPGGATTSVLVSVIP